MKVDELSPSNTSALEKFNNERDFSDKAFKSLCYAPSTSLYFDNNGNVRVCCHNGIYLAGSILENTLDEIWNGEKIAQIRAALKENKFGKGCNFCFNRTAQTFANAPMLKYDRFSIPDENLMWPQQLEFSISNACNLECVMCVGFYSSTIRSRREKLPALPRHYKDSFFEQLWKYLPHAKYLKFLGGEPFLVSEYYKIWEHLIANSLKIPCHVTTNGTQYNEKVEQIMQKLPMSFSVSMDGTTKETVEKIRVNAKYEEVLENARRFREYARERKTSFSFTFCLMRQNWQEFGDYCLLADSWDCSVGINTVIKPPEFGIYTLPVEELRKILHGLEAQAPRLESTLKKNKKLWFGELERIRLRCERDTVSDLVNIN